jgi:3-oxoacyl-[acyl-carrier-protein] synthase III
MIRSKIIAHGRYLPEKILTNAEMETIIDTSDDWIQQRTGIKQRHIAAKDQTTGDMAIEVAKQALARANLQGSDLDAIILATTTPDYTFPATAVRVQAAVGMGPQGMAFDIQAVCSGFIYALSVADNFIRSGQYKRIMVIGAEKFSNLLDWTDRGTCVLFGDGAAGVILEATEGNGTIKDQGIISTHLHSDGRLMDMLRTSGGAGSNGEIGVTLMEGREVFKHAVTNLAEVVEEALAHNNITAEDIDWLVPHQANSRIIETTAKKLNMSMDKVIMTVQDHGNTSAASIPLAFATAMDQGKFKTGELVLMEAMGAGFTWGAALVRL